jgi:hypothetical protein
VQVRVRLGQETAERVVDQASIGKAGYQVA